MRIFLMVITIDMAVTCPARSVILIIQSRSRGGWMVNSNMRKHALHVTERRVIYSNENDAHIQQTTI
jgi:hypothetical protein